jgi:hypothetical protein
VFFDTQIVVTGQLSKDSHSSLRVLSKNAQEEDVKKFLLESEHLVEPGDMHNVDAVLQVYTVPYKVDTTRERDCLKC